MRTLPTIKYVIINNNIHTGAPGGLYLEYNNTEKRVRRRISMKIQTWKVLGTFQVLSKKQGAALPSEMPPPVLVLSEEVTIYKRFPYLTSVTSPS